LRAIHAEQSAAHFDRLEERLSREGDAVERAVLIVRAVLSYKLDNRAVSLALESAGAGSPCDHAGYGAWHALLEQQATALGRPHAAYLAHALLAATRSDLVEHLSGVSDRTLLAGATTLVRSALRPL
jgi:hypothetical protein